MNTSINLKEIERKAFRSTYQDGLWDMYLGLVVVCMSIFIYRPPSGYSVMNIILLLLTFVVASLLFWAGKKYITLPRMGEVRFREVRKQKKWTAAIILGIFVIILAGLVGITAFGWFNPQVRATLSTVMGAQDSERLIVALLGSLIVGISMIVRAYLSDFPRGYYIALLMPLAVFLMIYLNQPVYPILIGALIIIPGLVLCILFHKRYPLHREDASNA